MSGGLFGSTLLDVVIGLFFIYLLLSLVCSAINEAIARMFSLRARTLENGLGQLLGSALATGVLNHPLIQGISNNSIGRGKGQQRLRPSYIPAQLFSQALLDVLLSQSTYTPPTDTPIDLRGVISNLPDGDAKKRLLQLMNTLSGDLTAARNSVENWFDAAMTRLSGAYKRQVQGFLLIIAAIVSFGIGADSFRIVQTLYNDPAQRAEIVAQATQAINPTGLTLPITATSTIREVIPITNTVSITSAAELEPVLNELHTDNTLFGYGQLANPSRTWTWIQRLLGMLPGLLVTIFALSLGAPFWFDILQKLVSLRSTGSPPSSSTTATS
jgi:hypothetical protein